MLGQDLIHEGKIKYHANTTTNSHSVYPPIISKSCQPAAPEIVVLAIFNLIIFFAKDTQNEKLSAHCGPLLQSTIRLTLLQRSGG